MSLPALMKLPGHRTANMTLRYLEITQKDLQREFHLARQNPRSLLPWPLPAGAPDPDTADASTVLQHLSAVIRLLDLFRQSNATAQDQSLCLLLRRLVFPRAKLKHSLGLARYVTNRGNGRGD